MLTHCLNAYSLNKFLYFRAIQGHAGEIFVDPLLQDIILSPDDFAEYIYHIGNAFEMHFIIQSGSIPGGRSNRKNRELVFFPAVNRGTDAHGDYGKIEMHRDGTPNVLRQRQSGFALPPPGKLPVGCSRSPPPPQLPPIQYGCGRSSVRGTLFATAH